MTLGDALRSLGMTTAFNQGRANFDRMAPRRPDDSLCLSELFHKTFLEVDEKGTEAAAATAVVVATLGGIRADPRKPIKVRVDRPFLFAIQHRPSSACLFLGRVTNPPDETRRGNHPIPPSEA
jgi:serpin B